MAIQKDLTIKYGSDFALSITVQNADGSAFDLTGCRIVAQVRKSSNHPVIVSFVPTITNLVGGLATLTLLGNSTKDLEPVQSVYDIIIITSGGSRYCFAEGNVLPFGAISR